MSPRPQGLDDVVADFEDAVTMTPSQLERWLDTEESQSVGDTSGDGESTGHAMGSRILQLKATRKDDLTGDDVAAMKKIVGYVARHTAQRPDGDVTQTRWRYSLMNWGHDPLGS